MAMRWIAAEARALAELRQIIENYKNDSSKKNAIKLAKEGRGSDDEDEDDRERDDRLVFEEIPNDPDLMGDRALLRFLRHHKLRPKPTFGHFLMVLRWRREKGLSEIRRQILSGECGHPDQFPHSLEIFEFFPQIVLISNLCDANQRPFSIEFYTPKAKHLFKGKLLEREKLERFFLYCCEYRSLALEQLSHHAEQRNKESGVFPYGATLACHAIKNMSSHSPDKYSKEFMNWYFDLCSKYYPLQYFLNVINVYEPFIPLTEVISFNADLTSSTANTPAALAAQFDSKTLSLLSGILSEERPATSGDAFAFEGHLFEFSHRKLESLSNVQAKRRLQALKSQNQTKSHNRHGSIIIPAPEQMDLDQFDDDDDYDEIHPIDNHVRFASSSPTRDPTGPDLFSASVDKKPQLPKKVGSGYLAKRRHDPVDFQLMPKNQEKSCLVWFKVACFDERTPKTTL